MPDDTSAPAVGVVIATHNRPELLRRALNSVLAQDYAGDLDVVVVFDRSEPMVELARDGKHRVRVLSNARTPGLAGARNTGILRLDTEFVAFCDDDDTWLPGKLAAQLDRLARRPASTFATTAMQVDYRGRATIRRAGRNQVTVRELARSRMTMLHSSSFLFRRDAMIGPGGFGLVDEDIPLSQGEDWDLLLRAARQHPIEHVDEPLVAIRWGESSYFVDAWENKNAAHLWLISRHPEFQEDRMAHGVMLGKLAFGHAALGHRREAVLAARQALAANWREPRVPCALLVVAGVPSKWLTEQLNKRGHGI